MRPRDEPRSSHGPVPGRTVSFHPGPVQDPSPSQHRVGKSGPGFLRPRPERSRTQGDEGEVGGGVDPEQRARLPEVAEGRRRVGLPGPMRGFVATDFGPSPQSQGAWRPKPGRTPLSPGQATVAASCIVSGLTRLGASISLASSTRSSRGLLAPCAGEPFSTVLRIPRGSRTPAVR